MVLLKKENSEKNISPIPSERYDPHSGHDAKYFYHLLHNSPSVIYVTEYGKDHVCTFVSDNIHEFAGYYAEEMLNKKFWITHIHPDDKHSAFKKIQHNIDLGKGYAQYRFKTHKRGYRWILDHHRVVYNDDVPFEVIGSWIDITDEVDLHPDVEYFINHDQLTGYVNRKALQRHISSMEKLNFFGEEQNNRMLKKPVSKARRSEAPGAYSST